jgi:hypothetical protein
MAEVWPRLAKKLSGDGQRKTKKSSKSKSKANPFAASGLEKFAALLEGIQAKKGSSLVERTASSLSAARSISRSAQEWTATTLARSASRRTTEPRQCPAFEALAPTIVGHLEQDLKNSSEERQPQESSSPPAGVRLPSRSVRSLHQQQGWRSQSALFVLVVMGTFMSSRFGTAGKSLASVLTFSAVIQVWRQGSVSSLALYFLTPLRSYLAPRMTFLPLKSKPTSPASATEEDTQKSDTQDSSLGFPAVSGPEESAPLSILLPIPESVASALGIGPLPMTVVRKSSGASRRLAKKISSRFKKLKMFSSSASSPSSLSVSESSHQANAASEPDSPTSHPSRPDRRRMCPFSRRLHKSESSEAVTELAPCIIMRRQRSSDGMLCKKSKLGRMLSSETLEDYNSSESTSSSASSSLHGKLIGASSTNIEDNAPPRDERPWPVVGLLVTLLFLLVGRFPAIMATSLFFVVVSNHDRAHSRGSRGRDNRALEAARKLQRSSPPRGQRWGATSPPRRF